LNTDPYIYAEDSAFLGEFLSAFEKSGNYLEIGVGNGGNILVALGKFGSVVGTDLLNLISLRRAVPRSAELIQADRANCFRPNVFDVIAFNPPYVPTGKIFDLATDGGIDGMEVPLKFLSSALKALKPNGIVVMLLSSENSLDSLNDYCEVNHLDLRRVDKKSLFFETLFLFVISRAKE